jgi:DNA-binding NtrC family response regulator
VAELPRPVQAKLLRVLESGSFERVGGEKTLSADFRVISATNRDLKAAVARQEFREDLYYRLNVVPLHLPPLRERQNDIPLLIDSFLAQAAAAGRPAPRVTPEALALLTAYDWPGNVRELRSVIQYALAGGDGGLVLPEHLPPELRQCRPLRSPATRLSPEAVQAALVRCGGNKVKAARLLGVGRATLYRFLKDVS